MKSIYTLIATVFITVSAFAQNTSNLIIFSEDGLKFYLMLNGVRQNEVPLTNVKVTNLSQEYYSAKIIFEDKKLPILDKKFLALTDADKIRQEVTYKIKRNNKMVNVLRFYSQVPMSEAAPVMADVPVINYNSEPMPEIGTSVVTTQQTTTNSNVSTNSNTNEENVTIGINVPGVNMNVNVNDLDMIDGGSTTTTTTTSYTRTTSTTTSGSKPTKPNTSTQPTTQTVNTTQSCGGAMAMSVSSFNSAKQTITKQKFDDTRLTTATQILKSNCLSATQIKEIMLIFSFEDTRLKLAKQAYSRCVDVNNYFLLNDAFQFESSVEELNEAIK